MFLFGQTNCPGLRTRVQNDSWDKKTYVHGAKNLFSLFLFFSMIECHFFDFAVARQPRLADAPYNALLCKESLAMAAWSSCHISRVALHVCHTGRVAYESGRLG